jgi:predicted RNA binding protein YcfA (HicA-like mRNA interferase family)
MKEGELLRKLHEMGCVFVKHRKKHDEYLQPRTGARDLVPRHPVIDDYTAKSIMKRLK